MKDGTIFQLRGASTNMAGLYHSTLDGAAVQTLVHKAEKFAKEAEDCGENINAAFDQFLSENGVERVIAVEVNTSRLF